MQTQPQTPTAYVLQARAMNHAAVRASLADNFRMMGQCIESRRYYIAQARLLRAGCVPRRQTHHGWNGSL